MALSKSRDEVRCVLKKKARFCSLNLPVLTGKIWLSILDEPYMLQVNLPFLVTFNW